MQCYSEHLQIDLKEIASWKILDCILDFLCSQKKIFKLSPKSDLFFCDKHGAKYFISKMTQKCHYIQHFWLFPLAFIDELWKTQKIRILKNENKNCWRYHHFTDVYQKPQSQGTVLDIPSETEFFCHFGSFFHCSIPPPPPNRPEKQTFETMKRASADVTILNLWNKKHDHIMYAYSDMQCNNFFVF